MLFINICWRSYLQLVGPTLKNCWFAVYRPRKLEVGQSVGFFSLSRSGSVGRLFLYIYRSMYGEHRKFVLVWFAKMKSYNMTILTGPAT